MPHIGHIVLVKEILKKENTEEIALVEPFTVLSTPVLPFKPNFMINIGLFNIQPDFTYNLAYFIYSPKGDKVFGNFVDIQGDPNNKSNEGIDITLNLKMGDFEFKETGLYHFRFLIVNLHEEKSTFFVVKEITSGDKNE